MPLPALPSTTLGLEGETRALGGGGFLELRRQSLRASYPDGAVSEVFTYDSVERRLLDAVVIVAHFTLAGEKQVFLRSAIRPPLLLRSRTSPMVERSTLGALWEVPAGLVEPDEQSAEGIRRCGARELFEELGIQVEPGALKALGPSTFPAPGMIGERQFFFEVEVDPARRAIPTEDGSPLERQATIVTIPLREAIALTRSGDIEDAKTEIALRRLWET